MPMPPTAVLVGLAVGLVILRLWFQIAAAPFPDESYYWLWGQHPALSYFDHPPMQAWVLGAMAQIVPRGPFGLRLITWITTGIVLALHWQMMRRAGLGQKQAATVLVVIMASPVMQVMTAITFHDHLLMLWLSLGMWTALRALEPVAAGKGPHPGWMIATGIAVGAAALTKLNGLILGLGLIAALAVVPGWRGVFRSVWLYLSMAIALAFLTPVAIWNMTHKSEGLQFTFSDRLNFDPAATWSHLVPFVVGSMVMISPFLMPAMIRALRRKSFPPGLGFQASWSRLAVAVMGTSTVIWLAVTPISQVLYYWNLVAWLAILPLTALALRSRIAMAAHFLWGGVFAVLLAINSGHVPLAAILGDTADEETALLFGWDQAAAAVRQAQSAYGARFVITGEHRHGAQLAFALDNPDVIVLSPRRSQFDLWPLPEGAVGGSVIVLTEGRFPMTPDLAGRFVQVEKIADLPIRRAGHLIAEYQIYLGQGFAGRP